ncbi:M28 family peptidase, partial [Corallococcus exercitus]
AFINLDAAGSRGRALLFQVGGGTGLARAYQRSFPAPWAMVVAQDLFQSGLVGSDTDFRVYREHGLPGLDLAFYEDGYAYHTALDGPERLEPGSLQHLGDGVLALVRELARSGWAADGSEDAPVVFHDVLGVGMVVLSRAQSLGLAVGATVFALAVLGLGLRRGVLQGRELRRGVARVLRMGAG